MSGILQDAYRGRSGVPGIPGIDGDSGEDSYPLFDGMLLAQVISNQNNINNSFRSSGIPGIDGDSGEDSYPLFDGMMLAQVISNQNNINNSARLPGIPGIDGEIWEDSFNIPPIQRFSVIQESAGKVGIGIAPSVERLHVLGDIRLEQAIFEYFLFGPSGVTEGGVGYAHGTGTMFFNILQNTRMTLDATKLNLINDLIVNNADVFHPANIQATGNSIYALIGARVYSNVFWHGTYFQAFRYHGTQNIPLACTIDDIIFSFTAAAYDGITMPGIVCAKINAEVDGIVAPGIVPSRLMFLVTDTVGSYTEKLRISGTGIGLSKTAAHMLDLNADDAYKPTTNTWGILSDRRIKTIRGNFTDGLALAKLIRPIRYRYNGKMGFKDDGEHIGIIAQDLWDIAPYMVDRHKGKIDGNLEELFGYQGHALPFILLNAIKELDSKKANTLWHCMKAIYYGIIDMYHRWRDKRLVGGML